MLREIISNSVPWHNEIKKYLKRLKPKFVWLKSGMKSVKISFTFGSNTPSNLSYSE
ncbi:hypothetical protein RIVM261_069370 [Rivularia sp. IAM M-261]|nr:hypothetical protein RIVM261_069370 [Rivularia sp. IAM M-261]